MQGILVTKAKAVVRYVGRESIKIKRGSLFVLIVLLGHSVRMMELFILQSALRGIMQVPRLKLTVKPALLGNSNQKLGQ